MGPALRLWSESSFCELDCDWSTYSAAFRASCACCSAVLTDKLCTLQFHICFGSMLTTNILSRNKERNRAKYMSCNTWSLLFSPSSSSTVWLFFLKSQRRLAIKKLTKVPKENLLLAHFRTMLFPQVWCHRIHLTEMANCHFTHWTCYGFWFLLLCRNNLDC